LQEPEHSRTEQATPYKRSEARKKGQVAKSLDFNSAVMLAGFSAVMTGGASFGITTLSASCRALLVAAGQTNGAGGMAASLLEFTRALLQVMLPVCVAGVILAIIANLVQAGPVLSGNPLQPQLSRLNPIQGFKRVYNRRVLVDGVKTVIKLLCFGAVTVGFFETIWPALPELLNGDPTSGIGWFTTQVKTLVFRILLVLLVIGLLDILWARWQYSRQLMMSRREMKEEIKRREGDPLIRQRLRELQRENLKQARSLGRIRDADVLITNPTHLAVALAYDRRSMRAPQVIAVGADLWAAQMKAKARKHGVTILQRRSLARRLYEHGAIDQPIPVETYVDVAQVYADLPRPRATVVTSSPS
jgi:flagellar biosynthesis protein FlhB